MSPRAKTSPVIPYITLRAGEHDLSRQSLVLQPYGTIPRLAYRDERPEDRGLRGELYQRVPQSLDRAGWPTGTAEWEQVHPARQRDCMSMFACHVCRCDVGDLGALFVEAVGPHQRTKPGWPEGHITCQPPVCLAHAKNAAGLGLHVCRSQRVALRARSHRWYGLLGTPYQLDPAGSGRLQCAPTPGGRGEDLVPFDHPQLPFVLGSQLAVSLHGVTLVDLDAELAAAPLT